MTEVSKPRLLLIDYKIQLTLIQMHFLLYLEINIE